MGYSGLAEHMDWGVTDLSSFHRGWPRHHMWRHGTWDLLPNRRPSQGHRLLTAGNRAGGQRTQLLQTPSSTLSISPACLPVSYELIAGLIISHLLSLV